MRLKNRNYADDEDYEDKSVDYEMIRMRVFDNVNFCHSKNANDSNF